MIHKSEEATMRNTSESCNKFLADLQQFLARYSTTGTFGRIGGNQEAARKYLATLDMRRFSNVDGGNFAGILDETTDELEEALAKSIWGFARKGLNIFLRDCFYNRYIYDYYGLEALGPLLEVPLDNYVAKRIRKEIRRREGVSLRWQSITKLDRRTSGALQEAAGRIAVREQRLRVDLDLKWWGAER